MINKRAIQEVNAGSMADIAFLLLIFFLVATTMNVDRGINRLLPPYEEEEKEFQVKKRNLLLVSVNMYDNIMIQGEQVEVSQIKDKAKEFLLNATNSPDLPEREVIYVEGFGEFVKSKGIISLQNDRGTSYDMYIRVQNELTRAINEMREDLALSRFGRPYARLSQEQVLAINQAIPPSISEAEPRNINPGGV